MTPPTAYVPYNVIVIALQYTRKTACFYPALIDLIWRILDTGEENLPLCHEMGCEHFGVGRRVSH